MRDASHVETETVDATGEVTTAPTCTTAGVRTFTSAAFENGAFTVQTSEEAISALGHDYVAVVTAPTCTTEGYTTHTCSRCDDTFTDARVDALGHDWSDWTVTTAPTCTEVGEEEQTCSRCGKVDAREVSALGHDLVHHAAQPATCTAIGWDAYDTCRRCDYTTYAELPATGHTAAPAVVENRVDPTCTEKGSYDSVVYCSVCGAELSREAKEIAALGHDLIEHAGKAPTCTEKGWKDYQTCSRCDYTTYAELAALGHDLVNHEAKAPTCTEIGWNAYQTCSRCDYTTYEPVRRSTARYTMAMPPMPICSVRR